MCTIPQSGPPAVSRRRRAADAGADARAVTAYAPPARRIRARAARVPPYWAASGTSCRDPLRVRHVLLPLPLPRRRQLRPHTAPPPSTCSSQAASALATANDATTILNYYMKANCTGREARLGRDTKIRSERSGGT